METRTNLRILVTTNEVFRVTEAIPVKAGIDRTLDIRGCVLLILKLRQELDGALLPVNSKLRLLEKKFNSKFWWRHLH